MKHGVTSLENQSESLEDEDVLVNNDETGSHESPEMDNECNMTVAVNPKMEEEESEVKDRYHCNLCDCKFKYKISSIIHIKIEHDETSLESHVCQELIEKN